MKKLFSVFCCLLSFYGFAQESDNSIIFSGFVKNDMFFDSRQTVSAREGHFLLFPSKPLFERNREDENAKPNMNMLAINTRLTARINGPEAFGAKTSGLVEGAFFGHTDSDVNGFRLRHAYVKLNWENTEVIAGQYWHPMFIARDFPGTVSFNTGVPFVPFSRNPQLRVSQDIGRIKLIAAALSQRDFTSPGGSESLRNADIPSIELQIQYNHTNPDNKNELIAGIGGGFKKLVPRLITDSLYKANESFSSLSFTSFLKYKTNALTYKAQATMGENMYDLIMMGGYACIEPTNPQLIATGRREYTNLDVMSVWGDIHTNADHLQLGIFVGYSENLGSSEAVEACFARGDDMKYLYRISPRAVLSSGSVKIGMELEYTSAAYAIDDDSNGELDIDPFRRVFKAEETSNYRFLLSVGYFF